MFQSERAVTYQISEDEFVRASRLSARPTRNFWIFSILSSLFLLALIVFASSTTLRDLAVGGLIGGIAGYLVIRYLISPWLVRHNYRTYSAIKEDMAVELTEGGVKFFAEGIEALVAWKHIHKWRENDEFLLIYQNPRLYHVLPKSLSSENFDLTDLKLSLKEHTGPAT